MIQESKQYKALAYNQKSATYTVCMYVCTCTYVCTVILQVQYTSQLQGNIRHIVHIYMLH